MSNSEPSDLETTVAGDVSVVGGVAPGEKLPTLEQVRGPGAPRRFPLAAVETVVRAKKARWGHARANTVADLAHQAGVKQCAVFHHDPLHSDELVDRKIAVAKARLEAHGSSTLLLGARERLELKF
ncbi:MAG TPA: hypothetical protein VLJ38_09475 [Polyangiaceae bacterium]|nr:hypothetical protein [Polyangiaceae bacterium]